MKPDYSLYLVTDSTAPILKGRDLATVVRDAIDGGVTIVQYRDKTSDTGHLVKVAKELHAITKARSVPLLINDRVDVALAVGAEGVHIGQDDMTITSARKLLGEDAIIGVTASSTAEAVAAVQAGADYLGIGTVFATPTKEDTKSIIGTSGLRSILASLSGERPVSTVCIGGINASNVQRVLYQSQSTTKALDGVAVVSAIIGADDSKQAAQDLKRLISTPPPFATTRAEKIGSNNDIESVSSTVPELTRRLAQTMPLCHNMTNLVVQNIAANVALCVGASPIMSNNGLEAPDLAGLGGSLVINMGTVTADGLSNYLTALRAYNAAGRPVVFDPVGAGATKQRRDAVKQLMAGGYFDLIKGNESEIKTVAGTSGDTQQRGVDSGSGTLTLQEKAALVREVATQERNVVLMTGSTDVVSDGTRTIAIENGHEYLGNITGSGCTLGTTAASYLAVEREDKLFAVITALLHFEIAAEHAAAREDVKGPGSFVPAWLDELYRIKKESVEGNTSWIQAAKITML